MMPSRRCKVCGERKELSEFPVQKNGEKYYTAHQCRVCVRKKKNALQRKRMEKLKAAEPKRRCQECSKVKRESLFHSPQATICNRCVSSLNAETGLVYVKDASYLLSTISENKKRPLRLLTIRGGV